MSHLSQKSLVVLGHGPQGNVWAEILRREGLLYDHLHSSRIKEYQDLPLGLTYIILGPDLFHKKIVDDLMSLKVAPKAFVFAHGFSVSYGLLKTEVPCLLVAPKAIAPKLREAYLEKKDVSFVVDAVPENYLDEAKSIARALGGTSLIRASFEQETICDLFTEQTLLCHSLPILLKKSHEYLVQKGIPAELAATELLEESKLMLQLISERGIYGMLKNISLTARVGAAVGSIENFDQIYANIKSGDFLETLNQEINEGFPRTEQYLESFNNCSFDQSSKEKA